MSKHLSRVRLCQNAQYVDLPTCTFEAMSKWTPDHQKGCSRTLVKAESKLYQRQCQSVRQTESDFMIVYQSGMWGILSEARMMSAYMSDWCQIKSYVNGCDWGSHGSQAFDMFRIRLACLGWWQIAGQKGHVGWCQKSQIWCLRLVRVQVKSLSGFISCHFLIFFVFVSAS